MGADGELWQPKALVVTYGGISGLMGADWHLRGCIGIYENLWGPLAAYGDLWGPMGAHRDLWGPMGTSGDLLGPMCTLRERGLSGRLNLRFTVVNFTRI